MKLCIKYQRPGLLVSNKIFEVFLCINLCKTCRPRDGAIFGPRAMNNLGRSPLGEVMYQISNAWAFCFQTRRFLKFFPVDLCKTSDSR